MHGLVGFSERAKEWCIPSSVSAGSRVRRRPSLVRRPRTVRRSRSTRTCTQTRRSLAASGADTIVKHTNTHHTNCDVFWYFTEKGNIDNYVKHAWWIITPTIRAGAGAGAGAAGPIPVRSQCQRYSSHTAWLQQSWCGPTGLLNWLST